MGACAPECVRNYLFDEDINIQGNKIFKKINTRLNIENMTLTEEEKKSLEECSQLLQKAEGERIKISKKFESFLYNTGACVLIRPTLERGLISYIINILTQIYINANKKKVKFSMQDFSLSNFITITTEAPFIVINGSILKTLKDKYDFDFEKNKVLKNGLDSILDFLSTIPNIKGVLQNQVLVLKNLILDSIKNLDMVKQIKVAIDGILFLIDFFSEITNGLIETQLKITKPSNIELYFRIAEDAAKKKINDPKELVLAYASGDNCGSSENWKENMTYKEYHEMKF